MAVPFYDARDRPGPADGLHRNVSGCQRLRLDRTYVSCATTYALRVGIDLAEMNRPAYLFVADGGRAIAVPFRSRGGRLVARR